ncbi:hypothetical protein RF11_15088 [Thelohanellus kitauei]|uniref:Uncharacterized protein n=1 Tax=Thelohanellus kitauei TaxID=669202 RepID=A0A0C2IC48_THEKT|nr:hypothetical protein RF11_15088 [Thelohanellus kitauei]
MGPFCCYQVAEFSGLFFVIGSLLISDSYMALLTCETRISRHYLDISSLRDEIWSTAVCTWPSPSLHVKLGNGKKRLNNRKTIAHSHTLKVEGRRPQAVRESKQDSPTSSGYKSHLDRNVTTGPITSALTIRQLWQPRLYQDLAPPNFKWLGHRS